MASKITSFTDLEAWQYGHKLALEIYQVTSEFPENEKFGLSSQMQRSAVSVTSNIAEGFGIGSYKDKKRFYLNSRGSVAELQNQLLIAKDIEYISKAKFDDLADLSTTVYKLVNGLIRATSQSPTSNLQSPNDV